MTDEEIYSKVSKIDLSKLTYREKDYFNKIIDVLLEAMILRNFFSTSVIVSFVFLTVSTLVTVIFHLLGLQQFSTTIVVSLIVCFAITACMTYMLYLYSGLINAALTEYDLLIKRAARRKEEE